MEKMRDDEESSMKSPGADKSHDQKMQIIQSPGVQRIDAIASAIDLPLKTALFISLFFLAYVYGLDNTVRYTFQTTATNSYATHSLLATVAVIRSIVAAAAQPAYARVADVFGRVELFIFSVMLYVIGTIIEASSHEVKAFSGGAILYQVGLSGMELLVTVIIADVTSLRSRLFFSNIPYTPYLVNAWIGGNVTSSILLHSTWQWGVGMFAILVPVFSIPVVTCLIIASRRAKHQGKLIGLRTLREIHGGYGGLLVDLFWRLDVIGLILLSALLSLILIPLTIAAGVSDKWGHADVIVMLVLGFVTIPFFALWEQKFARYPVMPLHLMKDRSVLGGMGLIVFINCAWYLQGDYLYTVMIVAFDQTILSATRISTLYSFVSVLTGFILGLVVRVVRYIKWFSVFGVCVFTLGMGLLIRYRGSAGSQDRSGLIGAQVILGLAGGFIPYAVQTLVQAATKHEHVALVTGLYSAAYFIGSSVGSSVSGAIWTNTLPSRLEQYIDNSTLALDAYSAPLTFVISYAVGTPERDGMIKAYGEVQRLLCITGACLCVPPFIFALILKNPKLGNKQSLDEAEGGAEEVTPVPIQELDKQ